MSAAAVTTRAAVSSPGAGDLRWLRDHEALTSAADLIPLMMVVTPEGRAQPKV